MIPDGVEVCLQMEDAQPWIPLISNFGLPTALLIAFIVMIWRSFIQPLGGKDGIIAKFFETQIENSNAQLELSKSQKDMSERLSNSVNALSTTSNAHNLESTTFYRATNVTHHDLIRIHGRLIKAIEAEFQNEKAMQHLREADEIVRHYLNKNGLD